MATSHTSNAKLRKPGTADRNWNTPVNENADLLDGFTAIGGLCVTLTETPSASLNVKVSAGNYQKTDGTVGTYAGTASQAITTATTKYLYLTDGGTLTVGASYPSTAHVRLATIVAGATTITSITDDRVQCMVMGSDAQPYLPLAGGTLTGNLTLTDAVNAVAGTSTGSKIGTATTQKIGFWNATPIVQPSGSGQATVSQTGAALTDSTTGTPGSTIADGTATYSQSITNNNNASLMREIGRNRTDIANLITLAHAMRTALVNAGLIKGSA